MFHCFVERTTYISVSGLAVAMDAIGMNEVEVLVDYGTTTDEMDVDWCV